MSVNGELPRAAQGGRYERMDVASTEIQSSSANNNTWMFVKQLKTPTSINVNGILQALILGATLPSLQTQELFLGKHIQNVDNVNYAVAGFHYKSGAYFRGRLFWATNLGNYNCFTFLLNDL